LAGGHEVDCTLEHEDEMLDLAVAGFGVLLRGVEIEAWTRADVVAEEDLFAGFIFGGDVVGCQFLEAVFASPD